MSSEAVFKEAAAFAMQAASSTRQVPLETLNEAIKFGEDQLVMTNGKAPSLDDALELEGCLRELRALRSYRKSLDSSAMAKGGL